MMSDICQVSPPHRNVTGSAETETHREMERKMVIAAPIKGLQSGCLGGGSKDIIPFILRRNEKQ